MSSQDLYHGAEAAKLLFNLKNGSVTADAQGRIFFAEREWQGCLVHGADRSTGESYVAKFRVEIPDGATLARAATSGNRDALILTLTPGAQVRGQVLEMYVRRGQVGSFQTVTIPGPDVQKYLEAVTSGAADRAEALRQVESSRQYLFNRYQLYSSEHQAQLNLAANSMAGFLVSKFNTPAPPMTIWTNAYSRLLVTQRFAAAGNLVKASAELQVARLWYLYAFKRYSMWKDGIGPAAQNAQYAIWASAASVVLVTVGACLAAGAATGWAGWSAASAASAAGSEGALLRIAAATTQVERLAQTVQTGEEAIELIEEAIEGAERAAALIP